MRLHALVAPGSEQVHTFHAGGLLVKPDLDCPGSAHAVQPLGPFMSRDGWIVGGAGGPRRMVDFTVADHVRAFTEAGMWSLLRVMSDESCPIRPLEGRDCLGEPPIEPQDTVSGNPPGGGTSAFWPVAVALAIALAVFAFTVTAAYRFRPSPTPADTARKSERADRHDEGTET